MTGPCHAFPRPLVTPARIDGRPVYRCTSCDRTWPLAHGPLGHPRGSDANSPAPSPDLP